MEMCEFLVTSVIILCLDILSPPKTNFNPLIMFNELGFNLTLDTVRQYRDDVATNLIVHFGFAEHNSRRQINL